MDIKVPSQFRGAKSSPSTSRFLGEFLFAPSQNLSPASCSAGDELSEDDVFYAGDDSSDSNNPQSQPSTPSSPSSTPRRLHGRQKHRYPFGQLDSFGILAALPENETQSVFKHKAMSGRPVPTIPKPPGTARLYSLPKYHQSAPVNVPMMPRSAMERKLQIELNEAEENNDGEATDDDGQMLPPHEIVARSLAKSPILSCSVLEGTGRTLKGRDLSQVRNAVLRQTGFLD
ncbi:hypothetical protein SAY86_018219 [Trapa natans]|uniref:Senescence regulator n=1 Tax=Trapa natans TaxID=22666 RepID=A0AAN7LCZ0_TRANT|nr:hypothetical protein SAY86_018219 [Trapa natans]